MRTTSSRQRFERGLTMVEVMLAIAVLAIVLTAVSWASLTSVRQNAVAGARTQAVQVLNYFGRRIAGGDSGGMDVMSWDYGELAGAFGDLAGDARSFDPNIFSVNLQPGPSIGIGSAQVPFIEIQVCWLAADEEVCVTGETGGPPISDSSEPLLPGIN